MFLLLFPLFLLGLGKAVNVKDNKTLVSVTRRSPPSGIVSISSTRESIVHDAVDVSAIPHMLANNVGNLRRLSDSRLAAVERCLQNPHAVETLAMIGVQSVDTLSEDCPVSLDEVKAYLEEAGDELGLDVLCEPNIEMRIVDGVNEARIADATEQVAGWFGNSPKSDVDSDDPLARYQDNLQLINIDGAWRNVDNSGKTPQEIILAIVDTGVDSSHPDLKDQMWTASDGSHGYNFVDNDENTSDLNGHGTHCAGIAAAQTDNDVGIAGIADVKIMALRAFGADGTGGMLATLNGLNWAVAHGATVSSHSYTADGSSRVFLQAIQNAAKVGHIVVVASGNDGVNVDEDPRFPCSFTTQVPSMMCVGSTSSIAPPKVSFFSDTGSAVNIAAPGENIVSTWPGDRYAVLDGTSMATPHVAGVTAMLATLGLKGQDLTNTVLGSQSQKLVANGTTMNFGELDAQNAVLMSLNTSSPSGVTTSPPTSSSSARSLCGSFFSVAIGLALAMM
ncbi:thermitase, putative [Perkinsus marinus ATCC 50983]|uniref:subtilisin n=1 Tax=Perkinsus marinus (strain ATCC 50983 / TXsc) TaxID=423536 RepID=C5KKJ8_PERM5|nr:thermitase, putative [Perkinsus marinus ATCC 50983]EER15110.1 thermitase, putative [Perkinsus marinus ATCC 50983]|eukprot:XP_002783314.1 thermitase, putative [Perkinsus marinus ATCC 50983]